MNLVINARFLCSKITGVQRYALNLAIEIKKEYPNVVFWAPKSSQNNKYSKILGVTSIGIFEGHLWEQLTLPLYLYKLEKPILLSLTGLVPLLYKNSVLTIHDMAPFHNSKWFSFKYRFLYKLSYALLCKRVLHIFTVSNFSKSEILKYLDVDTNKVSVIYNSCSLPMSKNNSHGINKGKVRALIVSSVDPRKNVELVLETFLQLPQKNFSLGVVGGSSKVFAKINNKNLYKYENIGYISDDELLDQYRKADVFIYPSLYEGFGLPPLEAMSQGVPVLCSNIASLRESCGDAAIYFDPNDAKKLAMIISELVADKIRYIEMIKKGYQRCSRFKVNKEARKLMSKLKKIHNENIAAK